MKKDADASPGEPGIDAGRGPGWGPLRVGLAGGLAALAVAAVFTTSLLSQIPVSDAFIPVYVSLTRWQPFCVGMARFGMLVPLLAAPFRDPIGNYLVQNFLNATCGAAAFLLLASCFLPGLVGLAAGTVALGLYACLDDAAYQYLYLSSASHWAPGLALGLGGLLVWRGSGWWARPAGGLLLLLSTWVDVTAALFVVPVGAGVWLSRETTRGRLRALLRSRRWEALVLDRTLEYVELMALAFAVDMLLAPLMETDDAGRFASFVPVAEWLPGWSVLARNFLQTVPERALVGWAAALGLSGVGLAAGRGRSLRSAVPALAALAIVVLVQWLGLGVSGWVRTSGYYATYLFPARVALFTLPALAAASAVARLAPRLGPPLLAGTGVAAAFLGVLVRYGPLWGPADMRTSLEHRAAMTHYGRALVQEGCTHLVARDEPAWTAFFYAAVLQHERGGVPPFVITLRRPAAELRWARLGPPAFLCAPADDPEDTLRVTARVAQWPALEVERRSDTIDLWRPRTGPSF